MMLDKNCEQRHEQKFLIIVWVIFSLFLFDFAQAKVEAVLGNLALQKNPNLLWAPPATKESEIIISRKQYVISYNKVRRNPNWVAWKVDEQTLGDVGRSNRFLTDRDLENYLESKDKGRYRAVSPAEYTDSCFDRGHQAPSADRSDSQLDNLSTFTMTNMIPQTPYLNRVVWVNLEEYTRDLVRQKNKKVYIIAGPIYDEDFGAIGPNADIQVPSKNFKVLIILDKNQKLADINSKTKTIVVIMPNVLADGSRPTNKNNLCNASLSNPESENASKWENYVTTLAEVQKQSGLTLFPEN